MFSCHAITISTHAACPFQKHPPRKHTHTHVPAHGVDDVQTRQLHVRHAAAQQEDEELGSREDLLGHNICAIPEGNFQQLQAPAHDAELLGAQAGGYHAQAAALNHLVQELDLVAVHAAQHLGQGAQEAAGEPGGGAASQDLDQGGRDLQASHLGVARGRAADQGGQEVRAMHLAVGVGALQQADHAAQVPGRHLSAQGLVRQAHGVQLLGRAGRGAQISTAQCIQQGVAVRGGPRRRSGRRRRTCAGRKI